MRRLEVTGLHKSFGPVPALRGIDLDVQPGEHMALLGPSGSGKSTLLRVLAGLEPPDQGDVKFDGRSQLGIEPHRRDLALVFQQYALYPHLTALGNITLGLRHGLRLSRRPAEERARDVAHRLGIEDLLDRQPRAMSGGQRQRVSLARALARQAGVVLLDEPMSGLDAQLRLTLRIEVGQQLKATGATVVHVTHDQSDAMASADRVAVIDHGEIQQVGAAEELYARPATRFVGCFLGTPPMNLIDLMSRPANPGGSPFGRHRINPEQDGAWLGIRPEHLTIGDACAWRTRGRVVSVELAGPDRIVHVLVDGDVLAVRTHQQAPALGTIVPVSCQPSDVHLFSGPGGLRTGTGEVADIDSSEPAPQGAAL